MLSELTYTAKDANVVSSWVPTNVSLLCLKPSVLLLHIALFGLCHDPAILLISLQCRLQPRKGKSFFSSNARSTTL